MQVVVIGQGYWGKGKDAFSAKREWQKQGGTLAAGGYTVLTFSQDDAVQSIGGVWGDVTYQGAEPQVEEVAPRPKWDHAQRPGTTAR